jgi:hypothetical protein
MSQKPRATSTTSATTIGITASEVEVAGVVGAPDGEGTGAEEVGATVRDGATDGATEGAVDAVVEGAGDGVAGDGDGATTVNVVTPRARSPSAADVEVQRTV